jgi:hypothetical protein
MNATIRSIPDLCARRVSQRIPKRSNRFSASRSKDEKVQIVPRVKMCAVMKEIELNTFIEFS